MRYLDNLLTTSGIKHFYGATITNDKAYPLVIKMAAGSAEMYELDGELISTNSASEAEEFIAEKIANANSHP